MDDSHCLFGSWSMEKNNYMGYIYYLFTKIGAWKQGEKIPIHIVNGEGEEEILTTRFIQPDGY